MNPNNAFPTPTPEEEATLRALDSLDNVVTEKPSTPESRPARSEQRPVSREARPVQPQPEVKKQAVEAAKKVIDPVKPVPVTPKPQAPAPAPTPTSTPAPVAPKSTPVVAPTKTQKPKRTADDPTGIKAEIESAPSRPLYDFFAAQNKHFKNNKGLIFAILTVIIVAVGGYFAFQYYVA